MGRTIVRPAFVKPKIYRSYAVVTCQAHLRRGELLFAMLNF